MKPSKVCGELLCNSREILKCAIAQSPLPRWLGWCVLGVMALYTFCVMVLSVSPQRPPILTAPLWMLAIVCLIAWVWKKLEKLSLTSIEKMRLAPWKVVVWVAIGYGLIILLCGHFTSPDTDNQWVQIQAGQFNDWHPVIHTWCLWLFAQIFPWQSAVVMIQAVIFALLCGWLCATLQHYQYRKGWIIGVLLFVTLSPASLILLRVLWKDTAFALAALGISICLIHLWHTQGRWLYSVRNLGGFLFLITLASFLRHNGIFFTIPLILLLPLFFRGIKGFAFALSVIILSGVCLIGYVALRQTLTKPNGIIVPGATHQGFSEAVGLPMTMMGEAFVTHPEQTPQEVHALLLKMAPRDFWEKQWKGDFNSVKFGIDGRGKGKEEGFRVSGEVLAQETTPSEFFRMFAQCCIAVPISSMNAFLHLTSLGWDPIPPSTSWCSVPRTGRVANNELNFVLRTTLLPPLGWFFVAPGFYLLLWILLGGYAFIRVGWKVLPITLPFIAYDFGTSLLLTGHDYRFFFMLGLCFAPIALLLLSSREKRLT